MSSYVRLCPIVSDGLWFCEGGVISSNSTHKKGDRPDVFDTFLGKTLEQKDE